MRRSGRSMNRKGRDRGAEMRLTERTRKLIPETRRGVQKDSPELNPFAGFSIVDASVGYCRRRLIELCDCWREITPRRLNDDDGRHGVYSPAKRHGGIDDEDVDQSELPTRPSGAAVAWALDAVTLR